MPEDGSDPILQEGQGLEPDPDPWAPPRASTAQAASIGTGATGAALLIGDQIASGDQGTLALIPDPARVVSGVGHLLGLQVSTSTLWTLGLVLVVLSVLLNVYSLVVRYRYALWVKPRWDAQIAALQRAADLQKQVATQARAQGFVGGDA